MLLAIDTCFNACSAALFDPARGVVASRFAEMQRGHAEALGPMVEALLADAAVLPLQLTRIAVTRGPGTFTGLRIGLAYAKGMSLALNVPLMGVDSLWATAAPHFESGRDVVVVQQAGGTGLFYWASYREGVEVQAPQVSSSRNIAPFISHDAGCVGTGASQFADHRRLKPDFPVAAEFIAHAFKLPLAQSVVEPLYLRAPDAKISADAKPAVRAACAEDLAAMAEIHAQSFTEGWSQDSLASSLSVPGTGALVVEFANTLYGFVLFQWVEGEAEINTLCVSPQHRRQHFGTDLMQGLLARLAAMKTSRVFLEVSDNNVAALRLYEKHGFTRTGLRRAYYATGRDAIVMQRVLAS
jgi:tRNA threonylcarbamoyladenosine biosynthesis protein TsaB